MNRYRIKTLNLVGLAAFVFAMMSLTSHASAQRRSASSPNTADVQLEAAGASDGQGVVNIQTASLEELQRLPGVGPSKAAAIVAQRERAAFRRVEDIMRVRGIGRATFRRLRPMLTISGPTTLTAEVRSRTRSTARDASGDEGADES